MEPINDQPSRSKHNFRRAKDNMKTIVKSYVKGKVKRKPFQAQSRPGDTATGNVSDLHHNRETKKSSESNSVVHTEYNEAKNEETTNDMGAIGPQELLGPDRLWAAAYERLEDDYPGVLADYKQLLLEKYPLGQTGDSELQRPGGRWGENVQRLADQMLKANQKERFNFDIGGKNIIVRDQLQKAIGFLVSTKDLVGAAISSQPYAALPWAGVMFIFPLLGTMLQQDKDAVEGFEYILSLLVRCRLIEDDFLHPDAGKSNASEPDYKLALSLQSKTIELYSDVYRYQIQVILHFSHATPIRLLRDLVVRDGWKGMIESLKAIEREIKDDLQGLSNHKVNEINRKLEEFRAKTNEFLELCNRAVRSLKAIEQATHIRSLPVAHSAAFHSKDIEQEPRCTPGTRLEILSRLREWLVDDDAKPILWLYGMAGTGKSTISRTVAAVLNNEALFPDGAGLDESISLGASFFFKRGDAERNRTNVLFPSFAHQLAYKRLGLESEIAEAIKRNASPTIGERPLRTQWEELILKPLRTVSKELSPPKRLIFIIDALDECQGKDASTTKRDAREIIRLLKEIEGLSGIQVRVLITSRNESHIGTTFKNLPEKYYDEIELPKVSLGGRRGEKKDDITIFLEGELSKIENDVEDGSKWPGDEDFRRLVEKAGGLFIYAATASKFLMDKPSLAKQRLDTLLEGKSDRLSPESTLNQIYSAVLGSCTQGLTDPEVGILSKILGLIVLLSSPLPISSLAKFAEPRLSRDPVKAYLEDLRSVVDLPKDDASPVELVHLSFREFLLDSRRCGGTGIMVEPTTMHFAIFERCLEIMSCDLHMDMCGLRKPGISFVEIPSGSVRRCMPPHLKYACRSWVNHLLAIDKSQQARDALVDEGIIHKFLREYILNWLESLSLIREVGSAIRMVKYLENLVEAQENPGLSKFLYDAGRFVQYNAHIIQEAPLQAYYSAVIFSPTKSIIRNLFLDRVAEQVVKLPVADDAWGGASMALPRGNEARSEIAISPDSKTIVSASGSRSARLWDAATGITITDIPTPESIFAVAYSPDGQTIAFGLRSGDIQLYDVETGETSYLSGHKALVHGLAFSPCPGSMMLASVADDATFRLWDVLSKQQLSIYQSGGWGMGTLAIAFAPAGDLVALGHNVSPGTVSMWDIRAAAIAKVFYFPAGVHSIAFSPDGLTVALMAGEWLYVVTVGSGDTLVRLNCPGSSIGLLSFSAERGFLAMISYDGLVRLLNPVTGEELGLLGGKTPMTTVAVSPDWKFIAYGSGDGPIRLCDSAAWDDAGPDSCGTSACDDSVSHSSHDAVFRGWELNILLSNNNEIALAFYDETTIWDPNKIEFKRRIPCRLQVISPDGEIGVSFTDKGVVTYAQMWNITSGRLLREFEDVCYVDFSSDGKIAALTSETEGRILQMDTWRERFRIKAEKPVQMGSVYFLGGRNTLLWYEIDPTAYVDVLHFHLCSLETGDVFYRVGYGRSVRPLPSHDGRFVAFKSLENEDSVCLLRVETQELRHLMVQSCRGKSIQIVFSPDSTVLALMAASDAWPAAPMETRRESTGITLWDTATGCVTHTVEIPNLNWMDRIRLNRKVFIETTGRELRIWDPETYEYSDRLPVRHAAYGLDFSEDGSHLRCAHGRLPLSSATPDCDCLYVDEDWVLQGGERLLWVPQEYRSNVYKNDKVLVHGGAVVLASRSNSAIFIKIDVRKTPLAKQKPHPQIEKR